MYNEIIRNLTSKNGLPAVLDTFTEIGRRHIGNYPDKTYKPNLCIYITYVQFKYR